MVKKLAGGLLGVIKEGVKDGTFREDTDAFLVRSMLLGTIEHLCIRKLLLGEPKNLPQYADPIVDIVLDSIKTSPKHFSINLNIQDLDLNKAGADGLLQNRKTAALKKKKG
jgi:hypothetical protein